ncbi:MAG TPA: MFS transporter [Egibacteraceae bacterium]|nr:MFS transporter [Egibacteraceae bacterium]
MAEAGGAALAVAVACCGLVLAALPVFLVGGLAVQIRAELDFSEAALGMAVSGALLTGAAAAPIGGRVADRLGARTAVLTGSCLSALALVGIFAAASSWAHVAVMLALSGLALALTDPGLAILIARAVPVSRQGLGFGLKEAAIPIATLAAGLAVPGIALTFGWRWASVIGLAPLVGLAVILPRVDLSTRADAIAPAPAPATTGTGDASPPTAFVLVAAAAGLGSAAASGVGIFLTESAVAMGLSPSSAGLLLAVGSVAGIIARIATGVLADRRGGPQLGVVTWMLIVGAGAMALGATGTGPLLVAGTVGAFAAGWGWSGLLFLSLVRARPDAPGTAAGIGVAGLAAGNALGPLLFGVTAQAVSFGAAWAGAAGVAGIAALLMRLARARLPAAASAAPA